MFNGFDALGFGARGSFWVLVALGYVGGVAGSVAGFLDG